jgi:hypothetical protein
MKFLYIKISCFVFLFNSILLSQSVLINEFMSSNNSVFPDTDGKYYDWIELYNTSDSIVNLNGYYLSDDTANIFKWQFPDVTMEPDSFLVVLASGNDNNQIIKHWETVINWGDNWKNFNGLSGPPPIDWNSIDFDASLWSEGPSGFGYGDSDDATTVQQTVSLYIRKTFSINDLENISAALLHIDYDDAFVAYLNGKEIARSNIGTPGIEPAYDETASNYHEATIYTGGSPEEYVIYDLNSLLVTGENVLAIQIHNYNITSSDLSAIPFLTFGMINIPENPNGSPEILNLRIPNLHTNFKLNSDGEYLIFSNAEGNEIDKIFTGSIPLNISKGRYPDGANEWVYFNTPTPGSKNSAGHYVNIEDPPIFSLPGGFYPAQISLVLSKNNSSAVINYTLDGSVPDSNSSVYTTPLSINSTTVVRAKIYGQNSIPSEIITNTYFINENISLPVISLSTNPENLWDNDFGIYVLGDSAETEYPYFGANFWQDWEKPVHIEFYETTGDLGFSINAGVQITGAWSRGHAQKSLAIYARSIYGNGSIDYKIFPELSLNKFEAIVLRNSGNDWDYSLMRDALMSDIGSEINIDAQAYRPAVLFINGDYWGIHNIREKINEHFIASHHNVNPDSINILEGNSTIVQGDNSDYLALVNFLETHDLSNTANYEYVKNEIDVDNFIDYSLCEIYFDNTDWPGNNIKYWRSTSEGSKWKWILFDSDFGFGLYNHSYQDNTLEFATEANGPGWPNPPWSTLLLRKLLENNTFKTKFINRFADLSNSLLKSDNIKNKINNILSQITPEMQRHKTRWGQSYNSWLNEVNFLSTFADNRIPIPYMRLFFANKFQLSGITEVTVNTDSSKGSIKVNSLTLNKFPWSGSYFSGVPMTVSAIPLIGYKFSHWQGYSANERVINDFPQNILNVTAVFEPDTGNNINIVINEINYNSSNNFNSEDWIEFYNNTDSYVDLSGWVFKDEDDAHSFIIPDGTILTSDGYLVLCRDSVLFTNIHPECKNFIGNIDFGFNGNGELLRLYDNNLSLVDSVHYDDESPWVTEPDGNGPTLSLINPNLDNSDPLNWKASLQFGTPGKVNDISDAINNTTENLPAEFRLEQNYPNPFNPSTVIRYSLKTAAHVRLYIYNLIGQKIRTLEDTYQNAGRYALIWDGKDDKNNPVSSGIYIYTIRSEEFNMQKKMILLR